MGRSHHCTDSGTDSGVELHQNCSLKRQNAIILLGVLVYTAPASFFPWVPSPVNPVNILQKLVPDVRRAASAADYERMVLEAVRQYGRGISR